MVNILIFRTDRIGDLILTCPTIISIQKYFKKCNTTLIASEKNYNYAKNLDIFDQIYKFPRKNIIDKLLLIKKLNNIKLDFIFIFDGKDRSIVSAIFITSKNKIALSPRIKLFYKISNIKFLLDEEKIDLNKVFQKMLADNVRRLAEGLSDPNIDAGFPKVHRHQLCVTIGEMQK